MASNRRQIRDHAEKQLQEEPTKPESGISDAAMQVANAEVATSLQDWLANERSTSTLSAYLEELLSVQGRSLATNVFAQAVVLSGENANVQATAQAIAAFGPRNIGEALLVKQMLATDHAATRAYLQAEASDGEVRERASNRAHKFTRLYIDQLRLLNQLQGTLVQQQISIKHLDARDAQVAIMPGGRAGGAKMSGGTTP